MVGDASRFKGYWTEERCAELSKYWHACLTDEEIGELMGRTKRSISQRRVLMGLRRDWFWEREDRDPTLEVLAPVCFPTFENITKEEAARARAGCPPSAPIRIPSQSSGMGNSVAICMGIGK